MSAIKSAFNRGVHHRSLIYAPGESAIAASMGPLSTSPLSKCVSVVGVALIWTPRRRGRVAVVLASPCCLHSLRTELPELER